MLPDAARLQEEEAEYRNRAGATRHRPARPLFTEADAARALALVRPVPFERAFAPADGIEARFHRSGHILGASIVGVRAGGRRLVYSGDLGRYDVPLLRDPAPVDGADTLVVESTYGDREHPAADGTAIIAQAVRRAVERRGFLLIPAFAIGRTQDLLFRLRALEVEGRVPRVPVYLDSPMAIEATVIYARHPEEHDAETARVAGEGGRPFAPARFHLCRTPAESKRLNDLDGPAVVIGGSGMATGGRILHHLRRRLPEPATTVLFVGYQAAGTRGRLLRDGAREVRIFGDDVPVRATILATDALSAHADRRELLRWLGGLRHPPAMTWCVHGEPPAATALRDAIRGRLGWPCEVAADGAVTAV
jgi:metallo-beta-lactamase family protein